jgi:hypothetical protein
MRQRSLKSWSDKALTLLHDVLTITQVTLPRFASTGPIAEMLLTKSGTDT